MNLMADLIFEPMHVVAERMRRREVSSVELTEAALGQVERWGERINPFVTLTADLAREMARERDAELAGGTDRGPLHGVPVVLKDLFETKGVRTTGGSKTLAENVPDADATVVRLLREAGAVFIGKTGMPEFATEPTSVNEAFGAVHNPWNLELDTSGSSSGTGAAVAAGMAGCGPGSDTGGSIRMPAAACGLVGLKPTYGRVSLRGVLPLSASRDHIGPMARTVRDAALLMNALAWYDEADIYSRDAPVEDYAAGLDDGVSGLRIGAFSDDGREPVTPDILAGFNAGLRTLEASGAKIESVDVAEFFTGLSAGAMFNADIFAHHGHFLNEQPENLSAVVRRTLEAGRDTSGAEVMDALRERDALLHRLERRLRGYDLVASPTLGVHLPTAGVYYAPLLRFTGLWDHNGWPAISVPVGLSAETPNPIGFQVIGRPWTEALLLRAARVIEREHALVFPPSGLR
jgi:aspartyl-tRNA(Asn)/glutamyl-tRNA(Gln) amidotransferase subunit A